MPRKPTEADTDAAHETQEATQTPKLTKLEAVRRALADGAVQPAAGVEYVREKFGFEMSNQQFSSSKNLLKTRETKAGSGKPPANGKAGQQKPKGEAAPVPRQETATNGAVSHDNGPADPVRLARLVKELVGQYGAGAVKEMADVVGS